MNFFQLLQGGVTETEQEPLPLANTKKKMNEWIYELSWDKSQNFIQLKLNVKQV